MLMPGKEKDGSIAPASMCEGSTEHGKKHIQEQMVSHFSVIRMNPEAIPEAAVLEREVFPDPWSEAMLESGIAEGSQLYFCARGQDGVLAGYVAMLTVLDEGELLRIGVASGFRRRGVASMLLEKVFQTAVERKLAFMLLEVRKGNIPAVSLYEKYGFSPEGIRKNYYQNPAEDALVMRKIFVSKKMRKYNE